MFVYSLLVQTSVPGVPESRKVKVITKITATPKIAGSYKDLKRNIPCVLNIRIKNKFCEKNLWVNYLINS